MPPRQRFERIIRSKVALAADQYLEGGRSLAQSLIVLPQRQFDAWADSIDLPYGRVFRKIDAADGIYVLPDCEGWIVITQKSGIFLPQRRVFATYKEAKRTALRWEFLESGRGI